MNQSPLSLTTSLCRRLLTLAFPVVLLNCGPASRILAGTDLPHPTFTWNLSPTERRLEHSRQLDARAGPGYYERGGGVWLFRYYQHCYDVDDCSLDRV